MCESPPAGFPFPTAEVQSILLVLSERYPEKVAEVVERLYRGLWGEGDSGIVTTDGFMGVLGDVFGEVVAGEILEVVSLSWFFDPFLVYYLVVVGGGDGDGDGDAN